MNDQIITRRRMMAQASAVTALGLMPAVAQAQTGGKLRRIVYGFSAGDAGDTLARMIADRLAADLGVPAIVENRGGASGRIGAKAVVGAAPDGLTLLFSPMGPAALHPVSHPNMDFDPLRDLEPVSLAGTFDIGVAVGPAVPAKTLGELVAWIKANPDKANYGTPGLGGLPHFFAVMFALAAIVTIRNVPYRGIAAVMNDILGGQLPIAFGATASFTELHNSGRVRVLATSGKTRSPFVNDVPTFMELGHDLQGQGWYSLYAPLKTPTELTAAMSLSVQKMMREPSIREKVHALGIVPAGTTPDELRRQQVFDRELWAPAIRASGFKPSD